MAPASPISRDVPSGDELDDILNGIVDGEDVYDTNKTQQIDGPGKQQAPAAKDAGLGLDEEIKIVKKRQPVPKLDENRLLSEAGIPKLRRISKERLRFKGKGHEYGDIARMLNMYQLWLDDLYPRAKFADGLTIIEGLGHKKRIQYMRKEWIDEGRPKQSSEQELENDPEQLNAELMAGISPSADRNEEGTSQIEDKNNASRPTEGLTRVSGSAEPAEPDEDELDALLAEGAAPDYTHASAVLPPQSATVEDEFADDMEAMAEMEDMW